MDILLEVIENLSWPLVVLVGGIGMAQLLRPLVQRVTTLKLVPSEEIRFLRSDVDDIRQRIREESKKVADAIEAKRQSFLNIPNVSFHYADKEQITNFYNDYFREPTVESVVSEMATEISGDVTGKLPQVLEAKAGGKDLSKWISTIKLPDTSLNGMFLRYQRETIKREQVSLGLEVVDVELTELVEFQEMVNDLKQKFELVIENEALTEKEAALKEKAAEKTLLKLEGATGFILIEGQFDITSSAGDDYYKFTFRHPVSEYMLDSQKTVVISLLLPKANIEPHVAGNYSDSIGQSIPLRVYGSVWQPINRQRDLWELKITPLAVY